MHRTTHPFLIHHLQQEAGSQPSWKQLRGRGERGIPLIGRESVVHSDGESGWGEGVVDIPVLTAPSLVLRANNMNSLSAQAGSHKW